MVKPIAVASSAAMNRRSPALRMVAAFGVLSRAALDSDRRGAVLAAVPVREGDGDGDGDGDGAFERLATGGVSPQGATVARAAASEDLGAGRVD